MDIAQVVRHFYFKIFESHTRSKSSLFQSTFHDSVLMNIVYCTSTYILSPRAAATDQITRIVVYCFFKIFFVGNARLFYRVFKLHAYFHFNYLIIYILIIDYFYVFQNYYIFEIMKSDIFNCTYSV